MSSMYPSGGTAARSCMRCGAPLASKESQCSRCGTYNPLPQGQQVGMFQQGGQGTGGAGSPWGAQSPQFPQAGNGAWPGATGNSGPLWGSNGQAGAWPQSDSFGGQNQQGMPPQQFQQNIFGAPNGNGFTGQGQANNTFSGFQQNPNQSSLNNAFFNATRPNSPGASPWNTLNNQQAKPAWMRGQDDEDDDNKKRPGAGVVIVIVILVVALIGGGAFAGYKILKHNSNTPNQTANTTVIATPTGTPLFHETFQNNKAGWDLTPPTGAKVTLSGGSMVLESDNNKLFQEPFPGGTSYGDFRLDLDVGLTSGDQGNGYGVYIRGASTQNSPLGLYYRFEVYGNGYFYIYKGSQDAKGNLVANSLAQSLQPSNAVNLKGHMNHLTIIAKGTKLTFIINGTTVANVTDASYKSGTMALFVSNVAGVPAGAQATFQNIAIFPAQ